MDILIIYLTRTQYTKNIALQISELLENDHKIDMVAISEKKKYHFMKFTFAPVGTDNVNVSSVIGSPKLYFDTFTKKRPKLDEINIDFNKYDLIFLGSPIWYGNLPPAINTFIADYASILSKKKIFIFITSGCGKGYTEYINILKNAVEGAGINIIGQLHKISGTYLTKEDKIMILNAVKSLK